MFDAPNVASVPAARCLSNRQSRTDSRKKRYSSGSSKHMQEECTTTEPRTLGQHAELKISVVTDIDQVISLNKILQLLPPYGQEPDN